MPKIKIEELIEKINHRDADRGMEGSIVPVIMDRDMSSEGFSEEEMVLPFSVSSELPCPDWFGMLILDHKKNSIVWDRFKDGASVRDGHYGDQVAVVESPQIDTEQRKLRINARFSKNNERAVLLFKDYRDRIRRNGSIRFVIHELKLDKTENNIDYYRAVKWEPIHFALLPDGEDKTIGLDRENGGGVKIIPLNLSENPEEKIEEFNREHGNKFQIKLIKNQRSNTMTPEEIAAQAEKEKKDRELRDKELKDREAKIIIEKVKADLQTEHRAAVDAAFAAGGSERALSVASIYKAAREFQNEIGKSVDLLKEADRFVKMNQTDRSFNDFITGLLNEKSVKAFRGQLDGLSDRDKNDFSVSRLVLSLDPNSGIKADRERGICREYAEQQKISEVRGVILPPHFLGKMSGERTLTVASATGGGNLVASDFMADQFIELARNKSVSDQVGVATLPGLVGNPIIPLQSAAGSGLWLTDETTDGNSGDLTVGQKTLTPHTYKQTVAFSRLLSLQGTPQVEQLAKNDLIKVAALTKDKVVFHGTGASGQPTGLELTSGVGGGTTKAGITFTDVVALETLVADNNLDASTMYYVTNPTIRGTLKTREKIAGYPQFIWDGNEMNGFPGKVSKQINSGYLFFGDFSPVTVGMWGGLDLVYDAVSSKVGLIYITVFLTMDMVDRYPGAQSFYKGVN